MVLRKITSLGLNDLITYKNTLENPEHREYHLKTTNRTTVPCLYIDDKALFESSDICDWLESNKEKITKE